MDQGIFLQKLSDNLEGSKKKIIATLAWDHQLLQITIFGSMVENPL